MRNLVLSSVFAFAFIVAGSAAWQANAAPAAKGTPEVAGQTENVRCWRNAPRDGCGWGWRRTRWGSCRPC
jgi:hypothetical protein